jgi:hypothetical protein
VSFSPNDRDGKLPDRAGRAHRPLRVTALVLLFSAAGTGPTSARDAAPPSYVATLRAHGIEPDAAGLRKYLGRLHRNDRQRREARRLVEQLGSDRFTDREVEA